jgi:hypothetical protein
MRYNLSTEHARSRISRQSTGRQLVLIVDRASEGSATLSLRRVSRHRSDLLIEVDPVDGDQATSRPTAATAALRSWRRIGSEFCSACLGIVAEAGAATAAVGEILRRGLDDGTLPGAVALLGYQAEFVETCMLISRGGASVRLGVGGVGTPWRSSRRPASEYPPMVMFLPADDPSLAECAAACRRLRSEGFDVRLEVVDGTPAAMGALGADVLDVETLDELDVFFDHHLEPCFPNLFQNAS